MGRPFVARIGANESVFGPSPRAIAAMAAAAADCLALRRPGALRPQARRSPPTTASRPDNVTVGEGIDGLLGNLVRLLVGAGHARS